MSDELIKAASKLVQAIAEGNCPRCGAKIESQSRQGRCAYAKPCGHRLGQVGPRR